MNILFLILPFFAANVAFSSHELNEAVKRHDRNIEEIRRIAFLPGEDFQQWDAIAPPLHLAVAYNDIMGHRACSIKEFGIEPEYFTLDYKRTFMEIVVILLEAGADINMKDNGLSRTPLVEAAYRDHTEMALFLIEKGADVKSTDHINMSMFIYGTTQLSQISKMTALSYAFRNKNIKIIRVLIRAGADPNQLLDSGTTRDLQKTVLEAAISDSNYEIVEAC